MEASLANLSDENSGELTRSIKFAGILMFLIAGLFVVAPRITPGLLPLLAALLYYRAYSQSKSHPEFFVTPLLAILAVFGVYLAINASWSLRPLLAYGKVGMFFLVIAVATLGTVSLKSNDRSFLERLALNVIIGVLFFGLYLGIEVLSGLFLRRVAATFFPVLTPTAKHSTVIKDVVVFIGPYTLNRSIAGLSMMLWPSLLIAATLFKRRHISWLVLAVLAIGTLIVTFNSEHETSMLALAFSATIFAVARFLPRTAIWSVAAGWAVASMLVVPIAFAAYSQNLHFNEVIPLTGRARIILWEYTAERVMEQPILGIGIQSTQLLDDAREREIIRPKGFVLPRRTSRHGHNIFMQTWYELGAVGAILLCLSGLAMIWRIAMLSDRTRPFALASFVCTAVISAFSWGLWQPWFMAAFALTVLTTNLAINLADRIEAPDAQAV